MFDNKNLPEPIVDLINLEIRNKKRVWKPFMEKYDCQIICELGVFMGENFDLMIEHNPQLAIAIDSWFDDGNIARNDMAFSQEDLNTQYLNFSNKMVNKSFVKVYREYTLDAVRHFSDEYFDLIYVDADHTYEGCLKDLKDWFPKLKKGGFFVGDDYREAVAHRTGVKFGVKEAVNDFSNKNNLIVYELPRYGWAIIKP